MRPFVTVLVIGAFLALMPLIGQAEAASPRTTDIAPNGYLVIQFPANSSSFSSYEVTVLSGPNVDVILTDMAGYAEYMNNKSSPITYFGLGTYLDTRNAAFYGELSQGVYCLIIDNTAFGTAQPNGQTVRVTYSYGTGGAGIAPRSDIITSLLGILIFAGPILLIALVVIIAWTKVRERSQMKRSPIPFVGRRSNDLSDQEPPSQVAFDPRRPHLVYLQAPPTVRPRLIRAIGRCPVCNGIIAEGWTQCSKCGWTVDRSNLSPFTKGQKH